MRVRRSFAGLVALSAGVTPAPVKVLAETAPPIFQTITDLETTFSPPNLQACLNIYDKEFRANDVKTAADKKDWATASGLRCNRSFTYLSQPGDTGGFVCQFIAGQPAEKPEGKLQSVNFADLKATVTQQGGVGELRSPFGVLVGGEGKSDTVFAYSIGGVNYTFDKEGIANWHPMDAVKPSFEFIPLKPGVQAPGKPVIGVAGFERLSKITSRAVTTCRPGGGA